MIVLGLGANLGRPVWQLRRALDALKREPGLTIEAVSPVYRSAALLPEGAPPDWNREFRNIAVACRAEPDQPRHWLPRFQAIERRLGRRPAARWAPRPLDIDILAWGGRMIEEPDLTVPHPGLAERPFALLPLADLAPAWLKPRPELAALAQAWRYGPAPLGTARVPESLTALVRIVNVTPDSFSGDGRPDGCAAAEADERAAVIDIGAESTRPGAKPIDADAEWRRLEPALDRLALAPGQRLSVDTRHPATLRRLLARGGVDWINDVGGLEDADYRALAAGSGLEVVLMHSLGIPPGRDRTLPPDRDPLGELLGWAEARIAALQADGIDRDRLILDPGIGFGKTPGQNMAILSGIGRLHALGLPLLVGHSRKSFLEGITAAPAAARDLETAVLSAMLAGQEVEYLRVHDTASQARALAIAAAWA